MKKELLSALIIATTGLVANIDVEAATISQSLDFGPNLIIPRNTTPLLTPNLTPVAFNRFDASLGTLNSVTWTFTGTAAYFVNAVGANYYDGESDTMVPAYEADNYQDQFASVLDTSSATLATFDILYTQVSAFLADGESTNGFAAANSRPFSGTVTWPASGTLAAFIGAGTDELFVDFSSRVFRQSTPYPMLSFATKSELSFTSTLTFDYTPAAAPVPVPAGLWLLASALAGFGTVRRRTRAG